MERRRISALYYFAAESIDAPAELKAVRKAPRLE
jgi:hypothetical protein